MTATLHTHSRPLASDDLYNSDDADLRNSPLLKPINPKLKHEPSPEPSLPYFSSSSSSAASSPGPGERKRRRTKNRASLSDAVLVSFLGSGLHSDVARQAGERPLASDNEDDESPVKGTRINMDKDAAPRAERGANGGIANDDETRPAETKTDHLAALAAGALAHEGGVYSKATEGPANSAYQERHDATRGIVPGESMDDVRHALPSIAVAVMGQPGMRMSPETVVKSENQTRGGLPPIQHRSPPAPPAMIGIGTSSGTGVTLPSLSESIGDLNHIKDAAKKAEPTFSQSPPSRPLPRFHGGRSPPKSPTDQFHRPQLPSPGQPGSHYTYHAFTHRRMSQTEPHYVSAGDYSSSTTETPSTDNSGPTPSAIPVDRMSIDGITNPQMGGYQCTHTGCTAQPFQTQYLLNSHANVHSQNRPHYCSVKGCPRSEGGKGFKRKNEMIRHGLVHDSPGYVCPFCPDREHKYPRPDNLQRHVRVHHVDKDKDDAQLKDVLAQRPDGPSRGRRRRGGTS